MGASDEQLLSYFYNNIAMSIPNYTIFKFAEPINKVNILKPNGTMLNNHPICGEITILNLINDFVVSDAEATKVNASVALNFIVDKLSNKPELYLCEDPSCLFCRTVDQYLYSINVPASPVYSKISLIRIFFNKIKYIFKCYIYFSYKLTKL